AVAARARRVAGAARLLRHRLGLCTVTARARLLELWLLVTLRGVREVRFERRLVRLRLRAGNLPAAALAGRMTRDAHVLERATGLHRRAAIGTLDRRDVVARDAAL